MRLINIRTLELKSHSEDAIPRYITLSHRWLRDEDEVTFEEYPDQLKNHQQGKGVKKGFEKISKLCDFVRSLEYREKEDQVEWVWVDTCCIDKRSSSELSESINSMARWYRDARLCVAYLADVPKGAPAKIWESEWFTRGWCLQELLFPENIAFCDAEWRILGRKKDAWIIKGLSRRTGVEEECLWDRETMLEQCVAKKMSWASRRVTKRVEDLAYCLLGLLNIQMPLLYGEGMNAFARLQEEIVRQTDDESVFAWTLPNRDMEDWTKRALLDSKMIPCPSILAPHPRYFETCGRVHLAGNMRRSPYRITNKGLEFESTALEVTNPKLGPRKVFVVQLNCGNVMHTGEGRTQDVSCLIILGETRMGRYKRLEIDPRRVTRNLLANGIIWQYICGDDAKETEWKRIGGTLFYIETLSSVKALGSPPFEDDGNFVTLEKVLEVKERRSRHPQSLGTPENHLPIQFSERARSSSHSPDPRRDRDGRLDYGYGRTSSHSPWRRGEPDPWQKYRMQMEGR